MAAQTMLKECYLNHNKFTAFPPVLTKLKKLEVLFLHHNELTNIPDSCIAGMGNLETFSANDNKIQQLPNNLGVFKKLKRLRNAERQKLIINK